MSRSGGPNFLGAKYAPFVVPDSPTSSSFRVRDVTLPNGLSDAQFSSRQEIRAQIDQLQRIRDEAAGDPAMAADEFFQQGLQLITSREAQEAFNIHAEPDAIRDAYGRNAFGQRALLARRLVKAGVPFVTLYDGGWDHHENLFDAYNKKMPDFESSIAALIEDLRQQGMLDRTLVIALGRVRKNAED